MTAFYQGYNRKLKRYVFKSVSKLVSDFSVIPHATIHFPL